jgi:predicted nucleic acid-binding Zn finger protein
VTIRTADNHTQGVHTYYVKGDSGNEYVVQFIRRAGMRRESCTCPDFTFRRSLKRTYRACKHIKAVRADRRAAFEARKAPNVVPFEPSLEVLLKASIAQVRSEAVSV